MIDYVTKHSSITAWGWICLKEVQRFTQFFKFDRFAFHRYMQSLGYDVTFEKVMQGLNERCEIK